MPCFVLSSPAPGLPRPAAVPGLRARSWPRRVALTALGLITLSLFGLLASPPASATVATMVLDHFSRTVTNGWGRADEGGMWSVDTRSRFSAANGAGVVRLVRDARARNAVISGSGTTNYLFAQVEADRAPTGNGLFVSLAGRKVRGVGQYEARLQFHPDGVVSLGIFRRFPSGRIHTLVPDTVLPDLHGGSGNAVRARLQVTGVSPTAIRAKAWPAGSPEPSGWMLATTDRSAGLQRAGKVGLRAYLSRFSVPLVVRFDDVDASLIAEPHPGSAAPTSAAVPSEVAALADSSSPPPTGDQVTGRDGSSAGSVPVGGTRYDVPAGAIFVSPSGNDAAAGTQDAPLRTLAHAVAVARSGGTVVLRAGSYLESVTIPAGKNITVQSFPGEAAWLDGSQAVTGWTGDGAAWRVDGWDHPFDDSPTYTAGAPDNTAANWSFVNAAHPLAAHPDQVFVDGVAQQQVGSRSAVGPGTFFVDTAAKRLWLGTDPAGHDVRASVLRIGLTIAGAGSTVRGIGVERYATPVPDKGALRSTASDVTIENVVVQDNATQGIYVGAGKGVRNTLRHVTAERNGLLGVESSFSDGLVVEALRAVDNNTEHFNTAPVSGGMKITSARGIAVRNSLFADNQGPGLWFDSSVYDATITGNDVLRNASHGISFEISGTALIADNLVAGNGDSGLKLNDASNLQVWNNTVVDNAGRPIWLVQDSRQASNLGIPGHDPRQSLPDPSVTWLLGPATVSDNVIGGSTSAGCLLCVQDSALHRTAAQLGITAEGNVYARASAGSPRATATWQNTTGGAQSFATLAAFRAGSGQEQQGTEILGALFDGGYRLLPAVAGQQATVAQPLPASIASRTGASPGLQRLGALLG